MDPVDTPSFDPYHKWLGIRDYQRAPNHYRLLGLELFENDEEVIRDAASRQLAHLRGYRVGALKEHAQRLLDEVLQARQILLDVEQKAAYDRTLRLQTSDTPSREAGRNGAHAMHAPGAASVPVECPSCSTENVAGRYYCTSCGLRLWEPCLRCAHRNTAAERHCGGCGMHLATQLQETKAELDAKFDAAMALAEAQRHADAVDLVLEIQVPDHSGLARIRERVQDILAFLRKEIHRWQHELAAIIHQGQKHFGAYDYEQAALILERVPEPYRTDEHRALLDQVRTRQVEVLTLVGEIRQAVSEKRTAGLLAKVEQLLAIQPDHAQARQLAQKLRPLEQKKQLREREALAKAAVALVAKHNYSAALDRLERIPESLLTPQLKKLLDDTRLKAAETDWLAADLREAVIYDEHLLPIAERLQTLRPQDQEVTRVVERLRHQAAGQVNGKPPFPTPPVGSAWGPPIETIGRFARIDISRLDDRAIAAPERFTVAAGLALQGLGQAVLQINLSTEDKLSLFGWLFKGRRKTPTVAWGIDLGRAALKAIKLSYVEAEGKVVAEAVEQIEHAKLLNQPEVDSSEVLHVTLEKFLARVDLSNAVLCVSIPSHKVLYRSITLPLIDERKIPDLVKFEARQQIPFPPDEAVWGYQVLSATESDALAVRECDVALLGLRRSEAQAALAPFTDRGIKIDVLQSDAAALLNFLLYEGGRKPPPAPEKPALWIEPNSPAPADVLVAMDIGTDSTNFIVSNSQSLVIRSIPLGGNNFSRVLVRDLQLTFAEAEKLKHTPTAARQLHQLYELLDPRLNDLVRETRRTIDSFLQSDANRRVKRLVVVGGGSKLHGLLRRLWRGG